MSQENHYLPPADDADDPHESGLSELDDDEWRAAHEQLALALPDLQLGYTWAPDRKQEALFELEGE